MKTDSKFNVEARNSQLAHTEKLFLLDKLHGILEESGLFNDYKKDKEVEKMLENRHE